MAAQRSLQRVLELVKRGDKDALVDYFATTNLTDRRSTKAASGHEVGEFDQVMEGMLLLPPSRHFLDSYAIRHLILTPPASSEILSGLMLGPNKYVQRLAVTSPLGESCILTFTMTAVAPPAPPPGEQQQQPGSAADADVATVWRLRSVRGEPQYGVGAVQPTAPSPELSPEQIVEAQLAALKRMDIATAFQFVTPGSQKIFGGLRKFTDYMAKHRRYGGLLGHIAATSVRRTMARPHTYMEIVSVTSASGIRFVFCYILSQATQGPGAGCWTIDMVKVVDNPRLLKAVDASAATQRSQRSQQQQLQDDD